MTPGGGRAPTVIIGIGNPMRRDDGIGPAAIARLQDTEIAGSEDVELVVLDGESTRLLEAWRRRERAIVIDAARSGEPAGVIHRIVAGDEELPMVPPALSSHGSGLAGAVALARALDALPGRLVVLGVEPQDVSSGEGLSAAVQAALPLLVDRVRVEVTGCPARSGPSALGGARPDHQR